jgi:hypothetical protein
MKVKQKDVSSYLKVIERATLPGLGIARAMLSQGFHEMDIANYLRTNGTEEDDIHRILREINKKQ